MSEVVILTEAAALQIKDMMKEHDETEAMLRVSVKGEAAAVFLTVWVSNMNFKMEIPQLSSTESSWLWLRKMHRS